MVDQREALAATGTSYMVQYIAVRYVLTVLWLYLTARKVNALGGPCLGVASVGGLRMGLRKSVNNLWPSTFNGLLARVMVRQSFPGST